MAKTTEHSDDWSQIELGDQVLHPKWGAGTVLYRSGSGENAKAIVAFAEQGQVKLMLKYAKLKKTGSGSLKAVEKARLAPKKVAAVVKEVEPAEAASEDEEEVEDVEIEADDEVVGFDDDEEEALPGRSGDEAEA